MLGIIKPLLHFRQIIQGCYIEIFTDNMNFAFLKRISTRIIRWKLLMNDFNYKLMFIKGKVYVITDNLSRCFISNQDITDKNKKYFNEIKKFLEIDKDMKNSITTIRYKQDIKKKIYSQQRQYQ
ncbi:Transposon Tf2-9 polyprotein [Dictyocoela muelleri]|nr:Transposon Tf2-9 polyprotein [Dictyocoela muelleri]